MVDSRCGAGNVHNEPRTSPTGVRRMLSEITGSESLQSKAVVSEKRTAMF